EAVAKYGSAEEAARWVATPETSPHVAGKAIDVGFDARAGLSEHGARRGRGIAVGCDSRAWLSEHGAKYGLCQIYSNEPWHYELRPEAIGRGCPPMYADPTHDPRMQRDQHARQSTGVYAPAPRSLRVRTSGVPATSSGASRRGPR